MRQETRALMGMVGQHRIAQMAKKDPAAVCECVVDDSGLRGVVKISVSGQISSMEFIESESTAGKADNIEDYVAVVMDVPTLGIMFPESKFPRDMAAAIFTSIVSEVRKRSGKDFRFNGFVYDDMGNVKPTK
ncbi:MAG TPA: hypothetical protein VGK23_09935 [Methanomassiliicoccales archaeon]|jgi:hypothetical protein